MKLAHIWMPDHRSLCDLRALPPDPDLAAMSETEFDEYVEEQQEAPVCGSCLLLAEHLRAEAATMYLTRAKRVHPADPFDAWRDTAGTRWSLQIDVGQLNEDDPILYERITQGIAPHRLDGWAEARREADESYFERLRQDRDRARGSGSPEEGG